MDRYTLLYIKWITNKDLLCRIENSAQRDVAAWLEGEFGENRYMYTFGKSLCCPPEPSTTLLVSYPPIENKI